jgi:hypothetical protein
MKAANVAAAVLADSERKTAGEIMSGFPSCFALLYYS